MNISYWRVLVSFMFNGGASGVVEYALGVLSASLNSMSDVGKEKVQAALNLSHKVLSVLESVKVLVPTKWQTAYVKTLVVVQDAVFSLEDLKVTKEELDALCASVMAAKVAWESPDDETCVDCSTVDLAKPDEGDSPSEGE